MNEYKKIFKIFLVGQEEQETKWLSEISKNGYHLINVNFATYYTFKKGAPQEFSYTIDMKCDDYNDDEYKLIYEDVGFEYMDTSNGYSYFRGNSNINTSNLIKEEQGRYLDRLNSQVKTILMVSLLNLFIFCFNIINIKNHHTMSLCTISINLAVGILGLLLYIKLNFKIKKMKQYGIKQIYKTKLKDWNKFYTIVYICIALIIICLAIGIVGYFI